MLAYVVLLAPSSGSRLCFCTWPGLGQHRFFDSSNFFVIFQHVSMLGGKRATIQIVLFSLSSLLQPELAALLLHPARLLFSSVAAGKHLLFPEEEIPAERQPQTCNVP